MSGAVCGRVSLFRHRRTKRMDNFEQDTQEFRVATLFDFRIRALRKVDAAALAAFYDSLSPQSRHFFEPYTDTSERALAEVIRRSETGIDCAYGAFLPDGTLMAHFFLMGVAEELPHLGLGLRDAYQGHGLGGVFLSMLMATARHTLRKKALGLTVMKENRAAVALYQRHGFRVIRDVAFRGSADSHEMRLDL